VKEKTEDGVSYAHKLVRVQESIMRIPTLAIHLDRLVLEFFFAVHLTHASFLLFLLL
jgi:aspartyl aminopeptidase